MVITSLVLSVGLLVTKERQNSPLRILHVHESFSPIRMSPTISYSPCLVVKLTFTTQKNPYPWLIPKYQACSWCYRVLDSRIAPREGLCWSPYGWSQDEAAGDMITISFYTVVWSYYRSYVFRILIAFPFIHGVWIDWRCSRLIMSKIYQNILYSGSDGELQIHQADTAGKVLISAQSFSWAATPDVLFVLYRMIQ